MWKLAGSAALVSALLFASPVFAEEQANGSKSSKVPLTKEQIGIVCVIGAWYLCRNILHRPSATDRRSRLLNRRTFVRQEHPGGKHKETLWTARNRRCFIKLSLASEIQGAWGRTCADVAGMCLIH